MERRQMDELLAGGLNRAVELMAVSAHNSFRFGGKNSIRIVTAGGEDLQDIAEYCLSLGDMSPLGARDGRHLIELMKEPMALMVMGDKRRSHFNFNCGACGYRSCAEMNAAEEVESLTANGPSCQFRNINLNMAANAAAATAWRLGLHCRIFSSFAFAAKAMSIIEDVDIVVSLGVSVAKKDPFFDRHKYWTQEHWDEIFKKEFPTFTRGFIGAIED